MLFSLSGKYFLSGCGLIAAAIYLYSQDYRRTGHILHLRGLFALAFVGGQGLACMKLSSLSTAWSPITWLSFFVGFAGFYFTFSYMERVAGELSSDRRTGGFLLRYRDYTSCSRPVFFCTCAITAISLGCFIIEAAALGYVPLFVRGVPHAYSYFHITGVHYFTVSCVLVPALSVIYFTITRGRDRVKSVILIAADVVAFAIPVLCVSRFQLLFSVLLAVITYIEAEGRMYRIYATGALLAVIPVYILLTVARSHDTAYLNAVFEMKNAGMPIFVTQPYMYVANNYDNFDCLIKGLAGHSWGLKMLAPLWTFTGLKFLFPSLTAFPVYVTKEELTTLTIFYDAYYDFGIPGVLGFSCLLGMAAYLLMRLMRQAKNPVCYLLYAQFAVYMLLSFFTTWFSNPSTWFYLAVTAAAAFSVSRRWGA